MMHPEGGEAIAEVDVPASNEIVQVCCLLSGHWPGSSAAVRERCDDLGAHYVRTLQAMVRKFAPDDVEWEFTCFTDRDKIEGVSCQPIARGLEGYFNKLYLFSPKAFPQGSRVLFFDLDTCIVRNWGPLAKEPIDKPVMLRDAWWHDDRRPASGVMSWEANDVTNTIWNLFPGNGIAPRGIRTDEDWLRPILDVTGWYAWQELLPEQFFSYKIHVSGIMKTQHSPPPFTREQAGSARVIYFHGLPRPHSVKMPWNPLYLPLS